MRLIHRISRSELNAAVVHVADGEVSLLAVVVDPMENGGPAAARSLLIDAVAETGTQRGEAASWPGSVASRLDQRLREARAGNPSWVIFAAAAITETAVHVCTAGDLRIHLVQGDRVIRTTRDHIVRNESTEWLRKTYGEAPLDDHATMLTRTLGSGDLPAETDTWPALVNGSLWLCSSEVHRFRSPEQYAASLKEMERDEPTALVLSVESSP
jgi:hypothetical protein